MLHAAGSGEGSCGAGVVPMPEECTVVEGGTEHTLKDIQVGGMLVLPELEGRWRRHIETAYQKCRATKACTHCSWMVMPHPGISLHRATVE